MTVLSIIQSYGEAVMFGIDDIRKATDIFSWIINLGKEETDRIKSDLATLLDHAKESLDSMFEISKRIQDFDVENFDNAKFNELCQECRRYYSVPEDKEKLQTHCIAVFLQTRELQSKLAQLLRVENVNLKKLDQILSDVKIMKGAYVQSVNENIENLEALLKEIKNHLDNEDLPKASEGFRELKSMMSENAEELSNARKAMYDARNHVEAILH
jgi:hypothetical protein